MAVPNGKIRSNSIGVWISNTTLPDTAATAPSGNTFGDDAFENDTWELVACATSGTFSGSMEVLDATTKDNDGQREILTGGLTWSMSVDGMIQYDLTSDVRSSIDLFDLWQNKTQVRIAWSTGVDDTTMYYGAAYVTTFEESAGLNEIASFSVTFEGDGSITKAYVDSANTTWNNNDE
jgi:TP901-1 family phage major tail protein